MQNGAVRGVIANIVNVLDIVIDKEHVFFGGTRGEIVVYCDRFGLGGLEELAD